MNIIYPIDIKPFVLDFEALTASSLTPIIELSDCDPFDKKPDKRSTSKKREQPKRTAKQSDKLKTADKDSDALPRKMLIYKGNKFYCDSKLDRKLIWKCSTSRFTNCTAQLTTKLNCSQISFVGAHDHANNTEWESKWYKINNKVSM